MFRFQTGFRAPVIVSRDGGMKARSPSQSFHGADDYGSPQGMLGWQYSPAPVLSAHPVQVAMVHAASQGGKLWESWLRRLLERLHTVDGTKSESSVRLTGRNSRNSQKQMRNCAVDYHIP